MLLPMLKAVSKMMEFKEKLTSEEAVEALIKVSCAKVIVDEIMIALETQKEVKDYYQDLKEAVTTIQEKPIPVSKGKTQGDKPVLPPKADHPAPPEVIVTGDEEFMCTVDEKGGLKIVGAPLDLEVELDGAKMTYAQAMGKTFKKVKIL